MSKICGICGESVSQSVPGRTVNSNGKHWHGKCYEAHERIHLLELRNEELVSRIRNAKPTDPPS